MKAVFNTGSSVAGKDTGAVACNIAAGELRKLKVSFTDSGTSYELSPSVAIGASPYSTVAHSLSGKAASDFVQFAGAFTQSEIEAVMAKQTELLALANGVSSLYVRADGTGFSPSAALSLNNQRITDLAAPTSAADAVNMSYADGKIAGKSVDAGVSGLSASVADDGKVLSWSSAEQKWVAAAAGGGSASGDLSGTYPGPTVAKIQGQAVLSTSPAFGQIMRFNGTNQWAPAWFGLGDLKTSLGAQQMPATACTVAQTLSWSSITDAFTCESISITAAADPVVPEASCMSGLARARSRVSI